MTEGLKRGEELQLKVEIPQKQEIESCSQEKLGYKGNASLACMGDKVRVEE